MTNKLQELEEKLLNVEDKTYSYCCEDCERARICHENCDFCDYYNETLEELSQEIKAQIEEEYKKIDDIPNF